jgi:hypothetical protein
LLSYEVIVILKNSVCPSSWSYIDAFFHVRRHPPTSASDISHGSALSIDPSARQKHICHDVEHPPNNILAK